jgi:hypothetical protein
MTAFEELDEYAQIDFDIPGKECFLNFNEHNLVIVP